MHQEKKTGEAQTMNSPTDLSAGFGSGSGKPQRMANLELLRCVAMMMVVVLHYLGKGRILSDMTGEKIGGMETVAWLLESFCIVAVNVYMLISGYFLCTSSFKPSRLVQLWLQIWTYSVGVGLLGALTGTLRETSFDTHYLLTLFLPITMVHYWFMTAYVFLYLLLPLIGMAVKKMTKRQMQVALGLMLFVFCGLKSFLPVRLEMDGKGYDCLWYLCVFLTAAYIRRFGIPFLEKKGRGLLLYVACCLLAFAGIFAVRFIYLGTGRLGMYITIILEYNHILPFLASLGLFGAFLRLRIRGRAAHIVNQIAPYTLGVYLLHENLGLRYSWQSWLGAGRLAQGLDVEESGLGAVCALFLCTVAAACAVFLCGILADMARKWVFDRLHGIGMQTEAYRRLVGKLEKADGLFR